MTDHHHHAHCDHARRSFLTATGIGALGLLLGAGQALASGDAAPAVGPDEALKRLKEGNQRFIDGKSVHPNLTKARMAEVKGGQHPFATIIGCSDSRVPVEALFDQGVGDLFVIRVAGNVADTDEIGTAEYGAGHLGTPLVVVLGHTKCGAVTAVVKGDKVGGSIPKLVDNIIPAAERAKAKGLEGDALINAAIRENVVQTIADLQKNSEEVTHLIHGGKLKIVGAVYNIETGAVEWI